MIYSEPVKIFLKMSPSFTLAALNKCLFITDEHQTAATGATNEIKVFSSSKEVADWFGNNAVVFKAVEFFLGQKRFPSRQPILPEFFTILSVKKDAPITKEIILDALNEKALSQQWYGLTCLIDTLKAGDLNSWLNENRKRQFAENITKTILPANQSDRYIEVYNTLTSGDTREFKAVSYMATCITNGAGSKSDMNILSMCTADVEGGDRQVLSDLNINFVEKRTSLNYNVVRTGVGTDGQDITEGTATDCIIYNLIDNLEIAMAEVGFKQDSRGYSLLESTIAKVMGEMYVMGLIADKNGQAEFLIQPINQTETERQLKVIRPVVVFRLADYAKTIELTLERTYGEVNA